MTGTLTITYRSPTPLYTDLGLAGHVESIEGRKVRTAGTLHAGDRLCVEAHGIFILVEHARFARLARNARCGGGPVTDRRVALAGPINFRDVGGYETDDGRAVRWGQVYPQRLAAPSHGEDGRRLAELGLRSALDFRAHDELDEFGIGGLGRARDRARPPADDGPGDAHRPPARLDAALLGRGGVPDDDGARLGRVRGGARHPGARPIGAPPCTSAWPGKDRTGVFSAVLLGVLGVPDETIVADYALTHEVVDALHARIRARRPDIQDVWDRLPPEMIGAHATTMTELAVLVRDRFGSWRDYARVDRRRRRHGRRAARPAGRLTVGG